MTALDVVETVFILLVFAVGIIGFVKAVKN